MFWPPTTDFFHSNLGKPHTLSGAARAAQKHLDNRSLPFRAPRENVGAGAHTPPPYHPLPLGRKDPERSGKP